LAAPLCSLAAHWPHRATIGKRNGERLLEKLKKPINER